MPKIKTEKQIIKLTNDCIFKRTFADEKEPENLFHLLNAIQEHRDYPLLDSLEIKNPILFNENFKAKTSILDIKAQDKSGKLIDIEWMFENLCKAKIFKLQEPWCVSPRFGANVLPRCVYPSDCLLQRPIVHKPTS